jgi:thiaminase
MYDCIREWLEQHSVSHNSYQESINRIFGEKPSQSTKAIKDYLNDISESVSPRIRKLMLETYMESAEFEYKFFDETYRLAPISKDSNSDL